MCADPCLLRSRLDRALELALALKYVHGGAGVGTMMHRDIKSVSGATGGDSGLSYFPIFRGGRRGEICRDQTGPATIYQRWFVRAEFTGKSSIEKQYLRSFFTTSLTLSAACARLRRGTYGESYLQYFPPALSDSILVAQKNTTATYVLYRVRHIPYGQGGYGGINRRRRNQPWRVRQEVPSSRPSVRTDIRSRGLSI